jgi:UDP-3-O-[3-hydroxymyristoyl] N-acetylglucosamine deacetylase
MTTNTILQHTLRQPVSFVGLGLHSGVKSRLTLRPCDDATGIFFRRKDVPANQGLIAARWHKVSDTTLSTVLTNRFGHSVSTVEHLMAALRLCGIDNLEIEVDGPEIPIMDGSAKPFVETLQAIGTRPTTEPRKAIWIHHPVAVQAGDRRAALLPDMTPRVSVSIEFEEPVIGAQTFSVDLNEQDAIQQVAPARTFGFKDQIEALRSQGLALGGSLNNAILVDDDQIMNPGGLRYEDEFVRHKVLDAIGDLALIGAPVIGHYQAHKSGHMLNSMLVKKLFSDRSAWSYISFDEFNRLHGIEPQFEQQLEQPATAARRMAASRQWR